MNKANEMSPLTKKVIGGLNFLADKITNLNKSIENKAGRIPEICALVFYAIMHCIITYYHEPWYDEAVAWQIARCASIKDIFLKIPHYEGHPPLWYLVLMPFAKMGADYETSLMILGLVFSGLAVALILLKSPFPRIVRLLIPFTYYFFYQYSVITRPYCMMMLAFVLVAITYKTRNERPGRHVLSLLFLCLTSAYGIIFAGCICVVWVMEVIREYFTAKKTGLKLNLLKDKRTYWLAILLVLALILIAMIMPKSDTLAFNSSVFSDDSKKKNGIIKRLIYTLFAQTAESTCTSALSVEKSLGLAQVDTGSLIGAVLAGLIILTFIMIYGYQKRKIALFLIPYLIYSVFGAMIYYYQHHVGIVLMFLVFWFWAASESDSSRNLKLGERDLKIVQSGAILFGAILFIVSLFWSIMASINEVRYTYGAGRNEAEFISYYGLDNYNIMTEWVVSQNEDEEITSINTNEFALTDNVEAYMDHNIFYNYYFGKDEANYSTHEIPTDKEIEETLKIWKEKGYPDVLYQMPELSLIWDEDELSYDDYALVYLEPVDFIIKNEVQVGCSKIYVRRDLLDELGLVEIEDPMFFTFAIYEKIDNPNMNYK
jgi:hypothetical protein